MAFGNDPRATPVLLILIALGAGYVAYSGFEQLGFSGLRSKKERVLALQDSITQLATQAESTKVLLSQGSAEEMRRKLDAQRASLATLRRLVPEQGELTNLLDLINSRARIRGVTVSQMQPLPPGTSGAYTTQRYSMSVMGHYDQVGHFLSDVASLPRIVIPADVSMAAAPAAAAKAMGDSSGALLEAKFELKTYLRTASAEETPSGL